MFSVFLQIEGLPGEAAAQVSEQGAVLVGNPWLLVIGVLLLVAAVLVFKFLKRVVINSVLGLIVWAIATYIFNVKLPFWASLIVSAIFGLAGIGAMLVLRFLGLI